MQSTKLVWVFSAAIFFWAPTVSAEKHLIRDGFWGGIDFGAGFLEQSFDEEDEDGTSFFLGFKVGYTINPQFLLGLELSGWLIEASDQSCGPYTGCSSDASKGEGIMQIFLVSRYYPNQNLGLFAKAGGGYVEHWNNNAGESKSKSGWGFTVGGGYDFLLIEGLALSPFATFSYGKTENWDYRAITFGLGITFL